jgi:hypothetical protein
MDALAGNFQFVPRSMSVKYEPAARLSQGVLDQRLGKAEATVFGHTAASRGYQFDTRRYWRGDANALENLEGSAMDEENIVVGEWLESSTDQTGADRRLGWRYLRRT